MAFNDRMPIYRQIILSYSQAFVRGDIKPGERVLSIREMAALLRVNSNTMQRVYQEMERDGLINSKRGTGYYFTEDVIMKEKVRMSLARDSIGRFIEEMRALGCTDKDIIDELKSCLKSFEKGGN
jgi:GntR family transcriptional regulator